MSATLGIIAGNGPLPVLVARAAKARGMRIVATAMNGETDPAIDREADAVRWVPVGKLGKILETLQRGGVRQALFAGGLDKKRFFGRVEPDVAALTLLNRLRMRGDDSVLSAVADYFAENGVTIVDSTSLLPELFITKGVLTRRSPDADEWRDIEHGLLVARALGALDVGQCVVVRRGVVTAVEAIDGTDATIRRGGDLAEGGAVVVKVTKPKQDLRFDLPAVGLGTLRVMREVRARALAVEAGRTLIFDRDEFIRVANRGGIAVVGMPPVDETVAKGSEKRR
ncbi:MAG: UDP-2,3-diacylglucosamine diphosphatase LpxI [Deltaproteobacteria bacterium]|nr:UDP-2,3-diacylglucosamine diphosphatase LpxI [Deltaproteobacteria bacterium]